MLNKIFKKKMQNKLLNTGFISTVIFRFKFFYFFYNIYHQNKL
jgi:hypothetical protein